MKRFLAMVLLAIPCAVFSQSITVNTYSGEDHIVITDKKICRSMTDRMVLSVGLSGVKMEKDDKDLYFIDLKITSAGKLTMSAGDLLTITLGNGEVINLPAADKDTHGLVRDIHDVNGFITHDYSAYPSFVITSKQIEDIISNGVKKVQCNTAPDMYVKEFKKDQVGKAVAERWRLLKETLSPSKSGHVQNDKSTLKNNHIQNDKNSDKPILFPKLFGLNKSVSVGIIGGGMECFDYGVIGINTTFYGFYLDFMGWPRTHVNDVAIDTWEDHSQYAFHVGYQIPFHKYKDASIRLIPMIGWASIKIGYTDGGDWTVGTNGIINSFHVTEKKGGFDYGAALVFQSKDPKIGYYNFYIGATKHTIWTGLGVDFSLGK